MENNYIEARCFTNLDDYRSDIQFFAAMPRVGEYVSAQYKSNTTRLKIVSIEHSVMKHNGILKPYIRVELNK